MTRVYTDAWRVLAMIAVIGIHATGYPVNELHAGNASWNNLAGSFFNQFCRFSVPLFFFLSGYALTVRGTAAESWRSFLSAKLPRLLLPYLTLTVVFAVGRRKELVIRFAQDSVRTISDFLILKAPDYHLYFLVILIQFYLLFHKFHTLVRKFPGVTLTVSLLLQVFLTADVLRYLEGRGWDMPALPVTLFLNWQFYFLAGISSGAYLPQISAILRKIPVFTFLAAVPVTLIWVWYDFRTGAAVFPKPAYYDHFSRLSVLAYSIVAFLCLIRLQTQADSGGKWVTPLAGISFFVYLWHTIVLRVAESAGLPKPWLTLLLVLITTTLTGLILQKLIPERARIFLGL